MATSLVDQRMMTDRCRAYIAATHIPLTAMSTPACTALPIESLPQLVTLAVLAVRVQALNDSGLVVLGEFTFEGQACDAGRSRDGLNLPPESAAMPAHGEMHADPQLPHQRRVRQAAGRNERRHVVTSHHRERPQPFPSRHSRSFMRARWNSTPI
jgi:hypothetical protein